MSTQKTQQHYGSTHVFSQIWPQAQQQGWHLSQKFNDPNELIVSPPRHHPAAANHWAGIYRNFNYGNQVVTVPHWFFSEVARSQGSH